MTSDGTSSSWQDNVTAWWLPDSDVCPFCLKGWPMSNHIEQQPLLEQPDNTEDDHNDNDDGNDRPSHSVSFKEEVQLIPPSLRSTTSSRETGKSHLCVQLSLIFFRIRPWLWRPRPWIPAAIGELFFQRVGARRPWRPTDASTRRPLWFVGVSKKSRQSFTTSAWNRFKWQLRCNWRPHLWSRRASCETYFWWWFGGFNSQHG